MGELRNGSSEWKKMLRLGSQDPSRGFIPGTEGHAWGRPMFETKVDRRKERWTDKRADPEDGVERTKREFAEKYGSFVEWDFAKAKGTVAFPPAPRAELFDPEKELEREWLERYGMVEKKSIAQKNREAFGKRFRIYTMGAANGGKYGATDGGLAKVMEHVGKATRRDDPHTIDQDTMDFITPFNKTKRDSAERPASHQAWLDRLMDAAHGGEPSAKRQKQIADAKRELIEMSAAFAGDDSGAPLAIDDTPREEGAGALVPLDSKGAVVDPTAAPAAAAAAAGKPDAAPGLAALRSKPKFKGKFSVGQRVRFVGGGRFKPGGACVLQVGDQGTVEVADSNKHEYVVRFEEYGVGISLYEADVIKVIEPKKPAAPPPAPPPGSGPGGMSDDEDD
eukprot:TRINITY_DN61106_c0_g1_i1.p1 TRINITY_DN61106_c0_g1~~TRINITY_DN61106_c0_g1_i1.p1  ORF type:complete len:429 (+),score=156.83 TRINITY_DN61106_c0_g1_i1:109-1287(+)